MQPPLATSTPPCCPSASGCPAPATRPPWPPGTISPAGPVWRGMREERAQSLGLDDPGTLTARAGTAYWTGMAGDATGARDQYAALLPIRERVLGPEDPDTLTTRHNLARWTGEAGDAVGARDQFAVLLPIRERVLGPKHPRVVTTQNSLAYWTLKADGDTKADMD